MKISELRKVLDEVSGKYGDIDITFFTGDEVCRTGLKGKTHER